MENVDFDPQAMSVRKIFGQDRQLVVPRYQRNFAWSQRDLEDFYNDFIKTNPKESSSNFIGTILLSDHKTHYEIIDGQQRLSTFTILFAVIRDILDKEIGTSDAKEFANVIQGSYIAFGSRWELKHDADTNNNYKFKISEHVEDYFISQILSRESNKKIKPSNAIEKRIALAYQKLYEWVKDQVFSGRSGTDDKLKLIHILLDRALDVTSIVIYVHDNEIAFNLFESHNAKGQALAKTDLIKSYYFSKLRGPEDDKIKKMDTWDSYFKSLDSDANMPGDRFFSYMIQSYEGNFSSSHLYRRIKPWIDDTSKFEKVLKTNMSLMLDIRNSRSNNRSVGLSLEALNDVISINPAFILILSLARNQQYFSAKYYEKIFIDLENFIYVYRAVSKSPTNILERLFSSLAKDIEDAASTQLPSDTTSIQRFSGRIHAKIMNSFNEIIPKPDTFTDSFVRLSYENSNDRKLIKYTFEKIETVYSNNLLRFGTGFSLEHIYPQNPKASSVISKNLAHTIGNLTPLSKLDNSSLGNITYEKKIDIYKGNADLYSIKSLLELDSKGLRGDELINARAKALAGYCYDTVFKII